MAQLTGIAQILSGDTSVVDTSAQHTLGTRARDEAGNEYIYMLGVASTETGSWVTFDEEYTTTLLVTNASGPVAIAQAAIVASRYGWYMIEGTGDALIAANTADNSPLGYETASGYAGDGRAAGDMIYGAISREAVTTPAGLAKVQIWRPFVTDGATV